MQFELSTLIQILSFAAFLGGMYVVIRYLQTTVDRICSRLDTYVRRFEQGEVRMERLETICKMRHGEDALLQAAKGRAR
jgi:hypothetical protein